MYSIMNNEIQKFKVSCSGWSIDVDSNSFESAASSGLIMAFKKFGSSLLLSTTIMVLKDKNSTKTNYDNCEFFQTQDILNGIGLGFLSEGLNIIQDANLERELSIAS